MKQLFILFLLILIILPHTYGQQNIKISGQIIDGNTKEPLAFASINFKNKLFSTTTNKDGYFSVFIPEKYSSDTIVISFVGYKSISYPVSECDSKVYCLKPISKELKEVVVKSDKIKRKRSPFLDISLEEALVRASKENKNVFLYFSDKACGFSKFMDENVFVNDTVINDLIEKYIPLKISSTSWRGESLEKELEIFGHPTFVIMNCQRKELKRNIGMLYIPKFLEFISTSEVIDSAHFLREKKLIEERKRRNQITFIHLGLKVGFSRTDIRNNDIVSKTGYEVGLFLSIEKRRMVFRSGLNILSKGGLEKGMKLNLTYLQVPLDVGLTVHKGAFFGLPSGVRIYGSPYSAVLLNKWNKGLSKFDFGFRTGIGAYIGAANKLELMFWSEFGLNDLNHTYLKVQGNRLFGMNISLTL